MSSLSLLRGFKASTFAGPLRATTKKFSVSSTLSAKDDVFHQPDVTPEELDLIKRRQKMRKALRAEYLRKLTDPYKTDTIVFDPAVQRYYAMHMTITERHIPTFKNWTKFMCSIILPVVLFAWYLKTSKEKQEKLIRSGKIRYEDRHWRHQ